MDILLHMSVTVPGTYVISHIWILLLWLPHVYQYSYTMLNYDIQSGIAQLIYIMWTARFS